MHALKTKKKKKEEDEDEEGLFSVPVVQFVHCVFVYACWAEVPGVPQSNSTCSTRLTPAFLSLPPSSHTYRFVHFPSRKADIFSSYITHIK